MIFILIFSAYEGFCSPNPRWGLIKLNIILKSDFFEDLQKIKLAIDWNVPLEKKIQFDSVIKRFEPMKMGQSGDLSSFLSILE